MSRTLISPSNIDRTSNCAASLLLTELDGFNNNTNAATIGVATHDFAENKLKSLIFNECHSKEKQGVNVDFFSANYYIKTIMNIYNEYRHDAFIEQQLEIVPGMIRGTADFILLSKDRKELKIFDLKTGSLGVSAVNNNQMLLYSYPFITKHAIEDIKFYIIQPSSDVVEVWAPKIDAVKEAVFEIMRKVASVQKQIEEFKSEEPRGMEDYVSEGSWCRFCPTFHLCPSKRNRYNSIAIRDKSIDGLLEQPFTLDTASKILDSSNDVIKYINTIKSYVLTALEKDKKVPGYSLRNKRGRRAWSDISALEDFINEEFGEIFAEDIFDTKIKSPAQIEKLIFETRDIPKKEASIMLEDYIFTASSGKTIVRDLPDDSDFENIED